MYLYTSDSFRDEYMAQPEITEYEEIIAEHFGKNDSSF